MICRSRYQLVSHRRLGQHLTERASDVDVDVAVLDGLRDGWAPREFRNGRVNFDVCFVNSGVKGGDTSVLASDRNYFGAFQALIWFKLVGANGAPSK